MASTAATRAAGLSKVVKPLFSRDLDEAKRRVRELYRAWYREVPNTGKAASQCVFTFGNRESRSCWDSELANATQATQLAVLYSLLV